MQKYIIAEAKKAEKPEHEVAIIYAENVVDAFAQVSEMIEKKILPADKSYNIV